MAYSNSAATPGVSGVRNFPSWIDASTNSTKETQAPEIFRRWANIVTIAGALERKVWLKVGPRTLYPSLFVLLVGGPGVGKTDSLRNVLSFWDTLPQLHIAPSSVSRASLADEIKVAERTILRPADPVPYQKFNSLQAAVTEFGTFLTAYDGEFISTLNDLYDCIKYKEKKRHMKEALDIPNPQLNIIAGTTPAWLGGTLPMTAWSEGFASRLTMIYSGERIKVDDLFAEHFEDEVTQAKLILDLKEIHQMYGQFQLTTEFHETFMQWYHNDCAPQPDHPKLEHYLPRRHTHFLKLAMIMSASRSNDLVLRMEDYQAAQSTMLEAEALMPEIFKAMRFTTDVNYYDETYSFVYNLYHKSGKAVPEHMIIHFIGQRAPNQAVTKILEYMVKANMLKQTTIAGVAGRPEYAPTPRGELGQ